MEITISNVQEKMIIAPSLEPLLRAVLEKTAQIYDIEPHTEVSLVLSDDSYIHQLNRQYRGKDCPTDVLSFALNEGEEPEVIDGPEENLLGDIIISIETAVRQAQEYGHSLEREMAFLVLHGMLHLLGYDHETEEDRNEMRQEEEYVLEQLGIHRE